MARRLKELETEEGEITQLEQRTHRVWRMGGGVVGGEATGRRQRRDSSDRGRSVGETGGGGLDVRRHVSGGAVPPAHHSDSGARTCAAHKGSPVPGSVGLCHDGVVEMW